MDRRLNMAIEEKKELLMLTKIVLELQQANRTLTNIKAIQESKLDKIIKLLQRINGPIQ